jgi:hypothetical protein
MIKVTIFMAEKDISQKIDRLKTNQPIKYTG